MEAMSLGTPVIGTDIRGTRDLLEDGHGLLVPPRDVEALARSNGGAPKKTSGPRAKTKDADTASLEVDLEDALGMSVDVADRGGAGEVRIKYESLEQLDEVCRRLMRR